MSVLEKVVRLAGSKASREAAVLFDSGSTYSCIRPELARELGTVESISEPLEFETAKEAEKVVARERVTLDIHINGCRLSDEFMVVEGLSEAALIGATTMQKWRIKLDFDRDEVIVDPRVTRLRLMALGWRGLSSRGRLR